MFFINVFCTSFDPFVTINISSRYASVISQFASVRIFAFSVRPLSPAWKWYFPVALPPVRLKLHCFQIKRDF